MSDSWNRSISKDTGNAKKAVLDPAGSVSLGDDHATLTISINADSYTGSETISKIKFYNDVSGGKGSEDKGTWYRDTSQTSNQPSDVSIGDDAAGTGVIITDNYTTGDDDTDNYYYEVYTSDGRCADPEMVLNKRAQNG